MEEKKASTPIDVSKLRPDQKEMQHVTMCACMFMDG